MWSQAGVVFAGNVLARGLGFLFPLVLANAVTKDDFGTVFFFVMTGFFVGELVLTGFPTAMTRFVAADNARGAWLASAIVGGVPLLIASLISGELLALAAGAPAGLMSMVVLGLSIDAYYFGLLRGLRRFRLLAAYRVSANLVQLVLLLAVIAAGWESVTLGVTIYSCVYLVPIALIEVARRPLRLMLGGSLRPRAPEVRRLARFAIPALVAGTAYAAIMNADVLFVQLLAQRELGDYGAAKSLVQPISLVPYAIAIVMLPAVAAAAESRRRRMLVRALQVTLSLNAAALGLYLAGRELIVDVVLPAEYAAAAASVPLLAAGVAAIGVHSVMSQWVMGAGRPSLSAASLVAGALATGVMHVTLTPAHGAIGAAGSVLGGALLANVVLAAAIMPRRRRGQTREEPATSPEERVRSRVLPEMIQ